MGNNQNSYLTYPLEGTFNYIKQPEYKIDGNSVYWKGNKVYLNGDVFIDLQGGYGRERNYMVYNGKKTDIRVHKFKYIKDGYGKDCKNVFYNGKIVRGADSNTFNVLERGYGVDKNHHYKGDKIL